MPPRAPSCGDWRRRICKGSRRIIPIRREGLAPNTENKGSALGHPQVRAKLTQNTLCKSHAAKVGLLQRRRIIADSCGALKLFANVAKILSDAFWFSAVR